MERKLSMLLMKNQDSKAMQRRVKKYKQRITKYRKAYTARRALARPDDASTSKGAVEMVPISPATPGAAAGGVAHDAGGPSSYERVPSQRDVEAP